MSSGDGSISGSNPLNHEYRSIRLLGWLSICFISKVNTTGPYEDTFMSSGTKFGFTVIMPTWYTF